MEWNGMVNTMYAQGMTISNQFRIGIPFGIVIPVEKILPSVGMEW